MSIKRYTIVIGLSLSLALLWLSFGSPAVAHTDDTTIYHPKVDGSSYDGVLPASYSYFTTPDGPEEQRITRTAPAGWATSAPPEGVDLDVTYINRAPMYKSYCVQYPNDIPTLCPGTESEKRWPDPGEVVTFTAHIRNKGTVISSAFAYQWFIDGVEVASGAHAGLAPGAEGTATYQWAWAHTLDGERVLDDHSVRFAVDPDDVISETYEINNSLEDRTNALALRIAITPEMIEAYDAPWDPGFSYSAEDWLQRQIAAMNWALANSVYPTTPQGATERVRINRIEITSTIPPNDRASDGRWFVDADYRTFSSGYDPITDIDWNLVHELSHQVGLIDLYNLNIAATNVKVLDREGLSVNFGFNWPRFGLMGGGDIAPHTDNHLYSSHSAGGISSTKGYRRGYYGEYQYDIPQQNYLLVLDQQGSPAGNVEVRLYQRTGPYDSVGDLDLDNTPEISGVTGLDGRFLLPHRSAGGGITTSTGHTLRDNPFGLLGVVGNKNRFLLELNKGDHQEFAWMDITAFNLAYWQGHTTSHTFTISSYVPPPGAPARPQTKPARIESNQASFCWSASPSTGVSGYHVYRAAPPIYAYERVSNLVAGLCYTEAFGGGNRVYAVTAVDGSGRESGFSNFVWAPRLNPYAVGVTSDGTRVILNPQNGYALLRQRPDGHFIQNFGSPHYHLEYSHFLAINQQDRLIFSHPGDYYTTRHSVRVADSDATPILEFGERGSGPGEFETPTGVAVWGEPFTIEGPHPADARTLLLLHLNDSYDGAEGETATSSGTTFAAGRYDQGVLIDSNDTLTCATVGNLNQAQGAIEFWLRPNWDGGDGQSYTFFEVGDAWFNRMRIMKDGANNLRFMVWDSMTEYGVGYNVGHWEAGAWHHVAVTWEGTDIALWVDGERRESSDTAGLPDTLADTLYIGSTSGGYQQANAVIDEFRISDAPRVGNSDITTYRILVADSGNHRIQAFDELGNFVSAYGNLGSGPGQFSDPRGLAVDGNGRVIVADSGNDRLQVLSFDGSSFDFSQNITASFSGPTGLAAYGASRIVVADTNNDQVKVLDAAGHLLAAYDAPNDGYTGAFNRPRGVAVEASGRIVVADTGNRRVVTIFPYTALAVTKQAYPDPVMAGERLTYTLHITNTGNVSLTAAITDTLPDHVTPGGVLTWTAIIPAPGGVWSETVVVTVEDGYAGPLVNVVQVSTQEGATGVYTETSQAEVLLPALVVTKQADPSLVQAGERLTYTIRVTNTGDVDLHATVSDTLPAHIMPGGTLILPGGTLSSTLIMPGGTLIWTDITLAPDEVWTTQFAVVVEIGYTGPLTNTVQVTTLEGVTDSYTQVSMSALKWHLCYLPLTLKNP